MWHFWSCFHHSENPQQTQHTHSLSVLHWNAHSKSFMRLRPRGFLLHNAKIMGLLSRFVENLKTLSNILSVPLESSCCVTVLRQFSSAFHIKHVISCTFDDLARTEEPLTLKSSCFNVYFNFLKVDNIWESLWALSQHSNRPPLLLSC